MHLVWCINFAGETNNNELIQKLTERFQPLFTREVSLLPVPDHVDYTVFGSIPFELFRHTKDERYFNMGKMYANTME